MSGQHSNPPLPHSSDQFFLTDGGIETTLIFHEGIDLPHFAAFILLDDAKGRAALTKYFESHIAAAQAHELGFILESPTWRASQDWGTLLGRSVDDMARVNAEAIYLMRTLRNKHQASVSPILISGCVGPRGDGYDPGQIMSVEEARDYHRPQIAAFAQAGADMVTAITMTNTPEAVGIVQAAKAEGIPVVISFTVETDGGLPTGRALKDAIQKVDEATGGYASYFMINCAHPDHFEGEIANAGAWVNRIGGIRANASRMSHAELDEAEELDDGNPAELGEDYGRLMKLLPNLRVLGGCCGTDHRHVDAMGRACTHAHHVAA